MDYNKLIEGIELNSPASINAIDEAQKNLNITFPDEYTDFISKSNGGEGWIGKKSYISLWPVDDISYLNNIYEVYEFAPGLILFGSDGGMNAYAFDTRSNNVRIVEVPFIGMSLNEITHCFNNFVEFLRYLYSIK